jgi:hypothetical protein
MKITSREFNRGWAQQRDAVLARKAQENLSWSIVMALMTLLFVSMGWR